MFMKAFFKINLHIYISKLNNFKIIYYLHFLIFDRNLIKTTLVRRKVHIYSWPPSGLGQTVAPLALP